MMEKTIKMKPLEPSMAEKELINFAYLRQRCSYKLSD